MCNYFICVGAASGLQDGTPAGVQAGAQGRHQLRNRAGLQDHH
jgi:hypothetical protein